MPRLPNTQNAPNPSRSWCITVNNPSDPLPDFGAIPKLRYGIWQVEVGEQGTRHVQGYLEFTHPVRMAHIKSCAGLSSAHLEVRRGSRDAARDYCRKDDTREAGPYEFGEWIEGQGTRSDLSAAVELIRGGAQMSEVAREHSEVFVKYHRGLQAFSSILRVGRSEDVTPTVILWHGPSGVGKSRGAREMARQLSEGCSGPIIHNQPNCKWWDGYVGQPWIILDDFAGSSMPYRDFKCIVDRYPMKVEIKGGMVELETSQFMITSTKWPDQWWNKETVNVDLAEINRRITQVMDWDENLKMFVQYPSVEVAINKEQY